jgi:putative transcription factor
MRWSPWDELETSRGLATLLLCIQRQQPALRGASVFNMNQDWEPFIIHRPKSRKQTAAAPSAATETVKRFAGGTNRAPDEINRRRLDAETEPQALPLVQRSVAQLIAQQRQQLGLSQRELAIKINEQQQLVADYELGRAPPSQAVLGKLERALKIRLRGKAIGEPL